MRLTVKKLVLLSLVEKTRSVLTSSGKETAPVLKNLHFEATAANPEIEGSRARLRAISTDQDLTVIAESSLVEVFEAGDAIIPGNRLYDIVRECKDVPINITTTGDQCVIVGENTRWDVQLMTEKYPPIPVISNMKWVGIPSVPLVSAIRKVRGAVSKDTSRPELTLIKMGQGGVFATDGTRLHYVALEVPVEVELQASAADELVKIMRTQPDQDIQIAQTETHILFRIANDVFLATKLNVSFQPVEQIINSVRQNALELQVSRTDLQSAVARVRITADTETNRIGLQLGTNSLILSTKDKNNNSCSESLDVHWAHRALEVSLNWMNLKAAIAEMEAPNIVLMFGENQGRRPAPVAVREENFQAIMNQLMVIG